MVRKIKIYKNFSIKKIHKKSIILIGNFDGLHIGHQKLFREANKYKKRKKLKIGVITFNPIPKMFFNPMRKNYRISNFDEKVEFLKKFNVNFIINKKFDKKFSKIKYFEFIKNILFKKINPKFIFVSDNFKFGNKREGNVNSLIEYGKKFNYKVINPAPLRNKNIIISSSIIRKLLTKSNLSLAKKYLKRNWSIQGTVQVGRKLGRKIGFPTCNVDIKDYIIPKLGVYKVKVKIANLNKIYDGIANLGLRPTFNQKKILLEVNIFNFSKNLYYKKLKVEFIKFIRGEKKFKNIDQLKKQIVIDIKNCKKKY